MGGEVVWREVGRPEHRAFICAIPIASGGLIAVLAELSPPTPTPTLSVGLSSWVDFQFRQDVHSVGHLIWQFFSKALAPVPEYVL